MVEDLVELRGEPAVDVGGERVDVGDVELLRRAPGARAGDAGDDRPEPGAQRRPLGLAHLREQPLERPLHAQPPPQPAMLEKSRFGGSTSGSRSGARKTLELLEKPKKRVPPPLRIGRIRTSSESRL